MNQGIAPVLCRVTVLTLGALWALGPVPALADTAVLTSYPEVVTVPKGAKAGDLELKPCRYRLEPDQRDYAADCGTLIVPENRKNTGRRLIALPLVRIHATGKNPAEPIFWFQGGPSAPNLMEFPSSGLLERHDLVSVGYRGIDGSIKLLCPEVSARISQADGPLLSARSLDSYAAGARECSARLEREGIDLAGYSMAQTIDDQDLARQRLGYTRIDLMGGSYGTRLEMIYMWRYPKSLNRVVMIGVNPPGHFLWDPIVTDRKLAQYGELCAKDAYCSARTSDLVATMRKVSQHMPRSWIGIPIDADRVRLASFFMLHESIATGNQPLPFSGPAAIDMWLDAAEGDPSGMALVSIFGGRILPHLFKVWGEALAMATSSMDYVDPHRDYDRELAPENTIIGAPASRFLRGMVRGWPINPDCAQYSEPMPSDLDTLLISGTLDFTTPFEQPAREKLMSQLSNGHVVTLREFGHTQTFWYSQPRARTRLLNLFFDEGRVDDSLYVYQPPVFKVQKSLSRVAHEILIIGALVIAVLGTLLGVAIRVVARRWRLRRS